MLADISQKRSYTIRRKKIGACGILCAQPFPPQSLKWYAIPS